MNGESNPAYQTPSQATFTPGVISYADTPVGLAAAAGRVSSERSGAMNCMRAAGHLGSRSSII